MSPHAPATPDSEPKTDRGSADVRAMLSGGLIASCQPVVGGPMDRPDIVAAFAQASLAGGAAGLRIEGLDNLRAVRAVCAAPIAGLIKQPLWGDRVWITPGLEEVHAIVDAGADIIAFDATSRERGVSVGEMIAAIHARGRWAMADCAEPDDGALACELGADIIGTTLSGYTRGPVPDGPDLALIESFARLPAFVVAEGRFRTPAQARQALRCGADAVVVGSAISRPEHIVSWFVAEMAEGAGAMD